MCGKGHKTPISRIVVFSITQHLKKIKEIFIVFLEILQKAAVGDISGVQNRSSKT